MPATRPATASITLIESFDINRIKTLLYSDPAQYIKTSDKYAHAFETLILYLTANTIRRVYTTSPSVNSRYYSQAGPQYLPSAVRSYLWAELATEIDVEQCYPSIALQLSKQHGITHTNLEQWLKRKDKTKAEKKSVSAVLNGLQHQPPNISPELFGELRIMTSSILSLPTSVEYLQSIDRLGKIFFIFEREERKILDKALKFFEAKQTNVIAYLNDGLLVSGQILPQTIKELNDQIIPYKFSIKSNKNAIKPVPKFTLTKFNEKSRTLYDLQQYSGVNFQSYSELDQALLPIVLDCIRYYSSNYIIKSGTSGFDVYSKLPKLLDGLLFYVTTDKKPQKVLLSTLITERYNKLILCRNIDLFSKEAEVFSTWPGFAGEVVPKNSTRSDEYLKHILGFIKEVVANNDENVYNYLLNWLANILQHPGIRNEVAIVLCSDEGVGKSTFLEFIYKHVFGENLSKVSSGLCGLLKGWNADLEGKVLIVLEELRSATDTAWQANLDLLKHKLTGSSLEINRKFQDVRDVKNSLNVICGTNNVHSIPMIQGIRRRFMLTELNHKYALNKGGYFTKLSKFLGAEGGYYFTQYLLKRNITEFDPRVIPETELRLSEIFKWLPAINKVLLIMWVLNDETDFDFTINQFKEYADKYGFNKICNEKNRIGTEIARIIGKRNPSSRKYDLHLCEKFNPTKQEINATKDYIADYNEEDHCLIDNID